MAADSPYFDGCYFDPSYFDASECVIADGHPPRGRVRVRAFPADDEDDALSALLLDLEDF